MSTLYPNLCYNKVCYKGTALYLPCPHVCIFQLEAIQDRFRNTIGDISNELKLLKQHSVMLMEQLQIIEEKHPTLM